MSENIVETLQEECGPFMHYNYTDRIYLFNNVGHIVIRSNNRLETWGKDGRSFRYEFTHWEEAS